MAGVKGRSGRRKKPSELKVLEGSFRKDRDGDPPKVKPGFPQPPEWLSEAEQQLWKWFPRPVWIVSSDAPAVDAAVSTYARILSNRRAQQATEQAGHPLSIKYTIDGDGNRTAEPKENPLITQEIKLWGRLMSILGTLGLTPADRSKMVAPKVTEAEDKWAGIL